MINFKAHYIQPVTIKKIDNSSYRNYEASFVELNSQSENDILSLSETNKKWNSGNTYISNILADIKEEWISKKKNKDVKYYAICLEKENFEKLKPENLLGVIEILTTSDKNVDYINFLQVNPDFNYENKKTRHFKDIGKGLLDSIKSILKDKDLLLESRESASKFYEKNGFRPVNSFGLMKFKRLA